MRLRSRKIPKELHQEFALFLNILNNVENINYGGCGISALIIYRWLKKREIDSKIIFGEMNNSYSSINRIHFKKNKIPFRIPHHIYLKIGTLYLDSEGFFKEKMKSQSFFDEQFLLNSINEGATMNYWNSRFDRNDCLHSIKEIINEYANDVIFY